MQVHLQKLCWSYVEWVRYCTGFFSDSNKSWIHLTDGCSRLHCIMPRQCSGKVVAKEVSTVWEICGIFVEQANPSTVFLQGGKIVVKEVIWAQKTVFTDGWIGKWWWEMDCPRFAHAHCKQCRTRCFDSTALMPFTANAVISTTSQIKNASLTECVVFLRWWWEVDSTEA